MSDIDHRTKQVIFTRQESGDFAIQVQREKCVRVDDETFVKFDRAVDVVASGHLADEVTVGQRNMTLAKFLAVVDAFANQWDPGNRTLSLLLLSAADTPYSLICHRQQLANGEWQPANPIVRTVSAVASETVTVNDETWSVAECAMAVRGLCDSWAGD